MNQPKNIGWPLKLGLALFGIIISLGMAEIGLRLLAPQATYSRLEMRSSLYFQESEWLIWELKPNFNDPNAFSHEGGEFIPYSLSINSLGFRAEEFPQQKPPNTYRIMALGDSFTFGAAISNGQTYPDHMQTCLDEHLYSPIDYQVINAGYASGFSPDSYYVFLREIAPPYEPDLVIGSYFVYNDFIDMLDTDWDGIVGDGLPERLTSLTRFLDLQGRFKFRNTSPRYRLPLLRDSHLFQLMADFYLTARYGEGSNAANIPGVNLNEEQAVSISDNIYDLIYYPRLPEVLQEPFDQSLMMIQAMQDLSEAGDFDYLTLLIPPGKQVHQVWENPDDYYDYPTTLEGAYPQKALRDFMEERGISYFDLLSSLRSERYYINHEGHWTAQGYELAGRAVCYYLIENHLSEHLLEAEQATSGLRGLIGVNGQALDLYLHDPQYPTCEHLAQISLADLQALEGAERADQNAACDWSLELAASGEADYQVQVYDETGALYDSLGLSIGTDSLLNLIDPDHQGTTIRLAGAQP